MPVRGIQRGNGRTRELLLEGRVAHDEVNGAVVVHPCHVGGIAVNEPSRIVYALLGNLREKAVHAPFGTTV